MGLKSRSKGKRGEREVVRLAQQHGLVAERTWSLVQSSDPRERRCDVTVDGRRAQVKVSADGFAQLYDGLDAVELLFVRADRRPWLAVLPAEHYLELLKRGEQAQ